MNRDQKIKIAMIICGVVLACAVILTFTGGFGVAGLGSYANADKYTAGETEVKEPVKNLDINWTSGKVTVAYHAENTITLRETAKRDLSEDEKLQWWLDGTTLRVQFTKPGIRWNMPGKELTITLPQDIQLEDVSIQLTSGDAEVPSLKAEKAELGCTSGHVDAVLDADNVTVESTSGDLKVTLKGAADFVRVGSTSGDIQLEAEKAGTISAGATSGKISITAGEAEKVKVGSTSGKINVSLRKVDILEIGATSGEITAALPENPGFTATVSTTSGKVSYDVALTREGDHYVCGDGSAQVEIGSTSGNVRIEAAPEK